MTAESFSELEDCCGYMLKASNGIQLTINALPGNFSSMNLQMTGCTKSLANYLRSKRFRIRFNSHEYIRSQRPSQKTLCMAKQIKKYCC